MLSACDEVEEADAEERLAEHHCIKSIGFANGQCVIEWMDLQPVMGPYPTWFQNSAFNEEDCNAFWQETHFRCPDHETSTSPAPKRSPQTRSREPY